MDSKRPDVIYEKRQDVMDKVMSEVTGVLRIRDASSSVRAIQEVATPEISICLGSGRCMFPERGKESRICAFCLRVSADATLEDATAQAQRFVVGN